MKYLLKKVFTLIITLFIVSLLAFLAFQVISDPATAILGTSATPESLAALREEISAQAGENPQCSALRTERMFDQAAP